MDIEGHRGGRIERRAVLGVKDAVKQVLTKQLNKRYAKQLAQRKISYDRWVRETEALTSEKGACGCGDFVLLVQEAGRLSEIAMAEMTAYFAAHPETVLLYGDEDVMAADGTRMNPGYKPCWSPDLFCS